MAFIGNTNTTQAFTPAVDFFSGNASTTAFTLSRPVASVAQVQAVVNNVAQNPSSAYTVSGNTITFTSAPSSGTNNIYVYYTSPITQVIAPSQGTVGTTQLQNGLTVNFADGSAAAPSITNDGDTNTGIFFPAADTIAFAEGGAEAMRIDSSGNVGIGTSSGNEKLNVAGAVGASSGSANFDAGLERAFMDFDGTNARFGHLNGASGSAKIVGFYISGSERAKIDTSSNFYFNSGYGSVATAYACRAWVNFNGTGTVAIRGSANVSSITDNNTGRYTVNFTTSITDANYSTIGTCNFEVDVGIPVNTNSTATGSVQVTSYRPSPYNVYVDVSTMSVAVFR